MFPKGSLTPLDRKGNPLPADQHYEYRYRTVRYPPSQGSPGGVVELRDPPANRYRDEAGVIWILYPDEMNVYHQPSWWEKGMPGPNKKFVAPDAAGGSFEAILQPDGFDTNSSPRLSGPYSYADRNWLRGESTKIGTYNYHDPTEPVSVPGVAHYWEDVVPHNDNPNYFFPILFEVSPDVGDWRTYSTRLRQVLQRFAANRKLPESWDDPDEPWTTARLVLGASGLVVRTAGAPDDSRDLPLEADLLPVVGYLADCLGVEEPGECQRTATELALRTESGQRHAQFVPREILVSDPICHDFNEDGLEDVAFAIYGGGSGGAFEWAVFVGDASRAGPLPEFVEVSVSRVADGHTSLSHKGNLLLVRNPIYLPGDPNCCPTGGERVRRYRVEADRVALVE